MESLVYNIPTFDPKNKKCAGSMNHGVELIYA